MKTPTRLLAMRTMWEPLITISVEVIMKSVDDLRVDYIKTNEDFNDCYQQVWNILSLSYDRLGGLRSYFSVNDFRRKRPFLKVVDKENILACATYRETYINNISRYKLTAIGCDQTPEGKLGVEAIVKDDINSNEYKFWVEASGVIEHYFDKYDGYKVHNLFVGQILQKDDIILDPDGFHYSRKLGVEEDLVKKVIFGFKDDTTFNMVNQQLKSKEFPNTKQKESKVIEGSYEDVHNAYTIIECIYRANEEDGVYELFPDWYDALVKAKETLEKYENNRMGKVYIEYADYLLDTMPVLELKPLVLN